MNIVLVESGKVIGKWYDDTIKRVSGELPETAKLYETSDPTVTVGSLHDGNEFFDPPDPRTLGEIKAESKRAVVSFADRITDQVMSAYPKAEVESWTLQAEQARRVVAGETLGADELLTKLAANTSGTVAQYAAAVLTKSGAFETIMVAVKDLRDQADSLIDAATDAAGIATALDIVKIAAEAKAAELGLTA